MPLGPRGQSSSSSRREPPREAPQTSPSSPLSESAGEFRAAPRTQRPRAGERIEVQAVGLDSVGAGQCPAGPITLHVPGILPGEHGRVLISHVSPHQPHGWASVQQRLSQSPERSTPICAGYGVCGGCTLQHLSYPAQLRWKHEQLAAALGKLAERVDVSACLRPPVASPGHVGDGSVPAYRSRVKLIATRTPSSRELLLGSYVPRSHAVVPMTGCRVHTAGLTATIAALSVLLNRLGLQPYDEGLGQGTLRYLLLRETAQGEQQLGLVVAASPSEAQLATLVRELRVACPALVSILLHQNLSRGNALLVDEDGQAEAQGRDRVLLGHPHVWDEIGGVPLRVSARSFLQVNRGTAARIYADVAADLAETWRATEGDTAPRILDVYCGVGGLGLTLLSRLPKSTLLGLEWSESAIADAQASADRMGLTDRSEFYAGPAEARLTDPTLQTQLGGTGIALLNPPRRGCSEPVLAALLALRPAHIAYVSCSPDSLVRDVDCLLAAGYRLRHSTPYDMHPGTPHIESVTLLVDGRLPARGAAQPA